jgi:hypothetical protein
MSSVYVGLNHFIDPIHLVRSAAGNFDQSAASFSRVLFSLSRQDFCLSSLNPADATLAAVRQLDVMSQLGTPSATVINKVKDRGKTGMSIAISCACLLRRANSLTLSSNFRGDF